MAITDKRDAGLMKVIREMKAEPQSCENPKCAEVLKQLKELVRCIRNNELGDYSPLMDEIFDSEAAIRDAETRD